MCGVQSRAEVRDGLIGINNCPFPSVEGSLKIRVLPLKTSDSVIIVRCESFGVRLRSVQGFFESRDSPINFNIRRFLNVKCNSQIRVVANQCKESTTTHFLDAAA